MMKYGNFIEVYNNNIYGDSMWGYIAGYLLFLGGW